MIPLLLYGLDGTEALLTAFSIDPIVARYSGQFLQVVILMLPAVFLSILLTKYLQAQVRVTVS